MGIGPPGISILKEMRQYMRGIHLDNFSELEGKTIGIDATAWLVEANDKQKNIHQFSKADYIVNKCLELKTHKITPLLVFDTLVPPIKDVGKLAQDKKIHSNYVEIPVRQRLDSYKIEFICVPYESDAQLAYLMEKKYIYAVMTGDSDLMACGVSKIIYDWEPPNTFCNYYEFERMTQSYAHWNGFTKKMFLEACIFSGCDYNPSRGFMIEDEDSRKPKILDFQCACELLRRHLNFIDVIDKEKIQIYLQEEEFLSDDKGAVFDVFSTCLSAFTRQQVYDYVTHTSPRLGHWDYSEDGAVYEVACGVLVKNEAVKELNGGKKGKIKFVPEDMYTVFKDEVSLERTKEEITEETSTSQGAVFSGAVTGVPGEDSVKKNPVYPLIQCLERLKQLSSGESNQKSDKVLIGCQDTQDLVLGLKNMASYLHDLQSREEFRARDGPNVVVSILNDGFGNRDIVFSGFAVVAAASTGNKDTKKSFMNLKIEELILQALTKSIDTRGESSIDLNVSLYDAIHILLTADDTRFPPSQICGNARKFAQTGIVEVLLQVMNTAALYAERFLAAIALDAIALNDKICAIIFQKGGTARVLSCLQSIDPDISSTDQDKAVTKACCSLFSKLAGMDTDDIISEESLGTKVSEQILAALLYLSESTPCYSDSSVLQEMMSLISILSLKSPAFAFKAGIGELAIKVMKDFPAAQILQWRCCLIIRNLVVKNSENIKIMVENGVETLIRQEKQTHAICKDAATDALRRLELDDYYYV